MLTRSLWLVPIAVAAVLCPSQVHGQATNTNCSEYGNQLNCTSTSTASAQQQLQRQQQVTANLGGILAQRRADKAAAQQAWSRAASEQVWQAGFASKANYDAMTEALQKFLADTTAWSQPSVNNDLHLDWSLLKDVEQRVEISEPDTDRRYELLGHLSYASTPGSGNIFRLDIAGETYVEEQKVWLTRSAIRYDPSASLYFQTEEGTPLVREASPSYEALSIVGDDARLVAMPPQRGFEAKVPPGAIAPYMLGYTIAAMSGELPSSFRIWILNQDGEVVPVEVRVVKEVTAREPVGPAGGTCAGTTGTTENRRALLLQVSGGAYSHTRVVLADAPHLKVSDELKCRIIR